MKAKLILGVLFLTTIAISACSPSKVSWEEDEIQKVKTVAVVLYTVPPTIEIRDDPQKPPEKKMNLMKLAQDIGTSSNGVQAATLAQKAFIKTLNEQGLSFKAMSVEDMMNNSQFMTLARTTTEKQTMAAAKEAEEKAKAKAEKEKGQGTAMKALSMLGSLSGGGAEESDWTDGVGPEGFPNFDLVPSYLGAESAITGTAGEMKYIKAAREALGVDAVIVINDPGYSWGCETCIGETGNASTQSAFLITMVGKNGTPILEMRQWFSIGGGNAAIVGGIINPLAYDDLFDGHGEKTARVFADFYKEEGGK